VPAEVQQVADLNDRFVNAGRLAGDSEGDAKGRELLFSGHGKTELRRKKLGVRRNANLKAQGISPWEIFARHRDMNLCKK
jgi:hypothetical protein